MAYYRKKSYEEVCFFTAYLYVHVSDLNDTKSLKSDIISTPISNTELFASRIDAQRLHGLLHLCEGLSSIIIFEFNIQRILTIHGNIILMGIFLWFQD